MNALDQSGFRSLASGELGVLLLSLVIYTALLFAGRAITNTRAPLAVQPAIGLTAVYAFFVVGSFASTGFSIWFPFGLLVALAALGIWRRRRYLFEELTHIAFSIIFLLPLCLLAVVVNNPMWDDFSQWLPSAQYLFREGHFPTLAEPALNHAAQSYPYSRALLHAWVNSFTGDFTINVQGLFNILFASSLLLWAEPLTTMLHEKSSDKYAKYFAMCFISGLVIIWTVTLNTKLIVSSYADPVFSVAIVHLFVFIIYLHQTDSNVTGKYNVPLALLLAFPLIIKESGFYYSLFLYACYWLFSLLPSMLKTKPAVVSVATKSAFHALHLVPVFLLKVVWGIYVTQNNLRKPFSIRNILEWDFSILPQIMSSAGYQLLERPYLILGSSVVLVLLVLSMRRASRWDETKKFVYKFALVFTVLTLLFHIVAYLAVFTEYEAVRAASFRRYMAPAGLLVWTALFVVMLLWFLKGKKTTFQVSSLSMILVLTVATISKSHRIVTPPRYSPGLEQEALEITKKYNKGETILIFDLLTNGIDAVVIKFHLGNYLPVAYVSNVNYSGNVTEELVSKWIGNYKNVHIHSATKQQEELIQKVIEAKKSDK
jgi:hypothetical protein